MPIGLPKENLEKHVTNKSSGNTVMCDDSETEYKQFWDVDLGVTYIPWEKVKVDDLEGFAEGGMIDQETVNTGKNPTGSFIV